MFKREVPKRIYSSPEEKLESYLEKLKEYEASLSALLLKRSRGERVSAKEIELTRRVRDKYKKQAGQMQWLVTQRK